MEELLSRSLTEIESEDWGEPEFPSSLVTTIHRLRHKPIGTFTVEDLRITIGQSVGLEYLVPLALDHLERDPLVDGDFYPGDLLASVLKVPKTFWGTHTELRNRTLLVAQAGGEQTDDERLRSDCGDYVTRWSQEQSAG